MITDNIVSAPTTCATTATTTTSANLTKTNIKTYTNNNNNNNNVINVKMCIHVQAMTFALFLIPQFHKWDIRQKLRQCM